MKLKYICQYCNKELTRPCALAIHQRVCKLNPNRQPLINNGNLNIAKYHKPKAPYGTWKCKWCNNDIIFDTRKQLKEHLKEKHPEKRNAWNKGLTKETDERVKQFGQTYSKRIKNKEISALFAGKKHTDEWRKNHSELQKERYKGISIYATVREKRKSYPEQYFDKIFSDAEKQYHVDSYFLDYAWPYIKLYIEVDGEQHYTESGLLHDKERAEILSKLGWNCITRIRWKNYIKLTTNEKENFINNLLNKINIFKNETIGSKTDCRLLYTVYNVEDKV